MAGHKLQNGGIVARSLEMIHTNFLEARRNQGTQVAAAVGTSPESEKLAKQIDKLKELEENARADNELDRAIRFKRKRMEKEDELYNAME
jgi:hypothetical protein